MHEAQNKPLLDVLHRSKEQSFAFDKIFSTESHETVIIQRSLLTNIPPQDL